MHLVLGFPITGSPGASRPPAVGGLGWSPDHARSPDCRYRQAHLPESHRLFNPALPMAKLDEGKYEHVSAFT